MKHERYNARGVAAILMREGRRRWRAGVRVRCWHTMPDDRVRELHWASLLLPIGWLSTSW